MLVGVCAVCVWTADFVLVSAEFAASVLRMPCFTPYVYCRQKSLTDFSVTSWQMQMYATYVLQSTTCSLCNCMLSHASN